MNPDRLKLLRYWIIERESIRTMRANGPPGDVGPWTLDPILHEWRFCNVDRNDDRETRWIHKNIIQGHDDSPTLWLNLVIARFVNWSPTLAKLGYFEAWDPERFERVMGSIEGKAYTGAYMVPAGPAGVPKHVYLARSVFGHLWGHRDMLPRDGRPLGMWADLLRQAPLVGDFLCNQIVTDYRYSRIGKDAADWETFFLPGPGSLRGMNRLFGRDVKMGWNPSRFETVFRALRTHLREDERLAPLLRDPNNLGNCLCEFDKYCRVAGGEGKPRSRFRPSVEALP